MSDIAFLSAAELARRLADRSISATEFLEHPLESADRCNPTINAVGVDVR